MCICKKLKIKQMFGALIILIGILNCIKFIQRYFELNIISLILFAIGIVIYIGNREIIISFVKGIKELNCLGLLINLEELAEMIVKKMTTMQAHASAKSTSIESANAEIRKSSSDKPDG